MVVELLFALLKRDDYLDQIQKRDLLPQVDALLVDLDALELILNSACMTQEAVPLLVNLVAKNEAFAAAFRTKAPTLTIRTSAHRAFYFEACKALGI